MPMPDFSLSEKNRPIRLRFSPQRSDLDGLLTVQKIEYSNVICDGVHGYLTCLSERANLPAKLFIGLPVEVQVVTDQRELQPLCGIVRSVRMGPSNGALSVVQLEVVDALTLMEDSIDSRIFHRFSPVIAVHEIVNEWLQASTTLASSFRLDSSHLIEDYPSREFFLAWNEGQGRTIKRILKQYGIGWVVASGRGDEQNPPPGSINGPFHRVILFNDTSQLPENKAGALRYHRQDATEKRDAITLWSPHRKLVPGDVQRQSWDYKTVEMCSQQSATGQNQGEAGNDLAALLQDYAVEMPHAGDTVREHEQLTWRRAQRRHFEAKCVDGLSGVRQMNCGEWNAITDHPELDKHPPNEREYLIIEVHHYAENNLPKAMSEHATSLLAQAQALPDWVTQRRPESSGSDAQPYMNRFKAVRRGTPVVPDWQPEKDFPRMTEVVGIVRAFGEEEVHIDELGRVQVEILGLSPGRENRAANNNTAWIRVDWGWAGPQYGTIYPLRAGMEVAIGFEFGDPSRPYVSRVLFNQRNKPPLFGHKGAVPFLSGTKTKELGGQRYGQLRFDDTLAQISVQLSSEHAHSEVNLGYLTQPRTQGSARAEPRGEGAELRSDGSVALRSGKAMLLSAWKRLQASETQLSRDEYVNLMQECLDLFKSLGEHAAQHQGPTLETKDQDQLSKHIKNWDAESNVDPRGSAGGEPIIGITAPGGISQATPEAISQYAGTNMDLVAQKNLQQVAGQHHSVIAGQGIDLFAQSGGLCAIAHQGALRLQSQHDDTLIDSAKNMQLRANEDLVLMGKTLTFIADDGSYIKIGGGIELGTQGAISEKASSFSHGGPAKLSGEKATFSKGSPDQRFALKYGNEADALAAANRRYKITLSDGSVMEGISDATGKTNLLAPDAMQIADIQIFKD